MKETGIIMSGDHPKKILDGTKTMTRRVIKPQPHLRDTTNIRREPIKYWAWLKGAKYETWPENIPVQCLVEHCPYGQVGDRLWVRESWRIESWDNERGELTVEYRAGGVQHSLCVTDEVLEKYWIPNAVPDDNWHSPLFIPRWASRITLEITEVRVERLQEITEEDAVKEGMAIQEVPYDTAPYWQFRDLWDSLNAKRGYSWETNCWVWVIRFVNHLSTLQSTILIRSTR